MDMIPILTISPSITELLGSIGSGNSGKGERYTLRLLDDSEDELYFSKEGGRIIANNKSRDSLLLSFPCENYTRGRSVVVPSCGNLDVTKYILDCATACVNRFEIIKKIRGGQESANGGDTVLYASGIVDKDIAGIVSISDEISVEVINDDVAILLNDKYAGKVITLLVFSDNNNSRIARYQNLPFTPLNGGDGTGNIAILRGAAKPYWDSDSIRVEVSICCTDISDPLQ